MVERVVYVEAVNLSARMVLLRGNIECSIETMLDCANQETDDPDLASAVVFKVPDAAGGGWSHVLMSEFQPAKVN